MCFLVAFLMGWFVERCLCHQCLFSKGKQAKLWVDSIRLIAADRIAELSPISQMGFVQFGLVL